MAAVPCLPMNLCDASAATVTQKGKTGCTDVAMDADWLLDEPLLPSTLY